MTDRPILFNGPMVRAILNGRKTQTRRVLKPQPLEGIYHSRTLNSQSGRFAVFSHPLSKETWQHRLGFGLRDRLWVREAWQAHSWASDCVTIRYRAETRTKGFTDQIEQIKYPNGDKNAFKFVARKGPDYWRPSIHMPRWASRLTLVVTDVRVERLQDISEADAMAEGVCQFVEERDRTPWGSADADDRYGIVRATYGSAQNAFHHLWDCSYGPDAWNANPWVTAVTFETHRCNIDQMGEAQ